MEFIIYHRAMANTTRNVSTQYILKISFLLNKDLGCICFYWSDDISLWEFLDDDNDDDDDDEDI